MNQTFPTFVKNERLSPRTWGPRVLLAIFFMALGTLTIVVFSPLRPMLEERLDYLGRIGLVLLLLAATLLARQSLRFEKYARILTGLLILAIAVSLDWFLAIYLLEYVGIRGNTPASYALLKLNEFVVVVGVVVFLTSLFGGDLGSIYIQKGRLKLGLTIGLIALAVCIAGSIPMAGLMFKAGNLSIARVLPWIPWLLVCALANAAQEELLFRGLFLRKLQPFFGKLLSNLLIILVFTLLHKGVTYSTSEMILMVVLIPLAFVWGWIMQKTDSIWGSILFHAGTDLPVFLGIFAAMS